MFNVSLHAFILKFWVPQRHPRTSSRRWELILHNGVLLSPLSAGGVSSLKCPNNFRCNCILPLSTHPGGLHCIPRSPAPHPRRRSPHRMLSGALLGASVTLPSATTTSIANAHFTRLHLTSTVSHQRDLSNCKVSLPSTSPLREMATPRWDKWPGPDLRQLAVARCSQYSRPSFSTCCGGGETFHSEIGIHLQKGEN